MADEPDVLDSTPTRRRWPLGPLVVVAVLAAAAFWVVQRGADEPPADSAPTATLTAAPGVPTVIVDEFVPLTSSPIPTADITAGSLAPNFGVRNPGTVLRAAQVIADGYCSQIGTWLIRLEPVDPEYLTTIALARPTRPVFASDDFDPDFHLQIEITWSGDRYTWRASRSALQNCP